MRKTDNIAAEIRKRLPDLTILTDEPMSRHCSFRIGGTAAIAATPSSPEETAALCAILKEHDAKPIVMGNGTNLLFTDSPIDRVVIKLGDKMGGVTLNGDGTVTAGCGILLARLAVFAADGQLSGLEFAHGIPGSLGGAVCMNAGAYGGEMKDVVVSTDYLDGCLSVRTITGDGHHFAYRHSVFSDMDAVLLSCTLRLTPGDGASIREKMSLLSEKRRNSQPLELPSAGSTFKRPAGGFAAALIEEAGLKGFAVGRAQVSEKHAGFVVNLGGATFADVMNVINHVRETVYKKTGILLEPEVKIVTD